MSNRRGDCFGRSEICEDFKSVPSITIEEKNNWPKYGDATYYKYYKYKK